MITWASHWAFLCLIPLAAILFWLQNRQRWGASKSLRPALLLGPVERIRKVQPTMRARLAWVPTALLVMSLILAILALARPQIVNSRAKRSIDGIDIMMVLDVSDSMLIEDMQPVNRLEACKKTIEEFIQKRTSDRIGLIIFSGESYTRVPLTLDFPVLLENLKGVHVSRQINIGTAIGVALANAVARLKDSKAKTKVIVLLTDGENNSGKIDPLTALDMAKSYGIRVYTIGAGQDGEAQLPVERLNAFGQRIKTYQPIHSKVNDELLTKIAEETGGKYFRAETTDVLDGTFKEIDRLEKSSLEANLWSKTDELFEKWLNWAIALGILSILLGVTVWRRGP